MKPRCFALILLLWSGRAGQAQAAEAEGSRAKVYSTSGVVQQVSATEGRVTIHHKAIPDFMPEMTMDFKVRDTNELRGVLAGAEIGFKLLVLRNDAWIEDIHTVGYVKGGIEPPPGPEAAKVPELREGDRWPDAELLADDGRRIRFSDFRGRTVALTFFFTRCPLPEFCPRMNSNFAAARALLQSAAGARTNYCFLSISFDSDFDRPAQLTAYAHAFRQGGGVPWVFAAAPPETLARLPRRMGLSYRGQGGGISHNLRTVVLDPQGQVFRQFDGNDWSSEELTNAMEKAHGKRVSNPSL